METQTITFEQLLTALVWAAAGYQIATAAMYTWQALLAKGKGNGR